MPESRGQIDRTCTASIWVASALSGASGTQTPLGKEAQLDFLPIPSLISPPTVSIGPTPLTLWGGGALPRRDSAGDESIFSSQGGGGQGGRMGLPLAPGPRAARCPPAYPPLLVNCLGALLWAQEEESWSRASFAPSERDPRQEKGPACSFSPCSWRMAGRDSASPFQSQ